MKSNVEKTKKFSRIAMFIAILALVFILVFISSKVLKTTSLANEDIKAETILEADLQKYVNYDISETDKGSVVEYNLRMGINYENEIPVKQSEIVVNIPQIDEQYPYEVKVITDSTKATNGKTNDASADYEYDSNNGVLTIKATNQNEKGEIANNVKTDKEARDQYKIICYYNTYTQENPERELKLKVASKIILSAENDVEIGKELEKTDKVTENVSDLTSVDYQTDEIYNGYIKSNIINGTQYETKYKETEKIEISKKEAQEKLQIVKNNTIIKTNNENEDIRELGNNGNILYESIKLTKTEIVKLLGEEGTIEIFASDGNSIVKLDKETETAEDGTITINFENGIECYTIKTSNIQNEGTLNIENTKVIKSGMLEAENVKIRTNTEVTGLNEEKYIEEEEDKTREVESFKYNKENDSQIQDAKTNVEMKISNTEWTNKQQNETTFDITLDSSSVKTNLFENPSIRIALPSQVEKVILGTSSLVYANGLNLQEPYVEQGEDGRFYIVANIEGVQNSYDENNLGLVGNLKIPATIILKKDIEDAKTKIQAEYTNRYTLYKNEEKGTIEKEISIKNFIQEELENQEKIDIEENLVSNENESNIEKQNNIPTKETTQNVEGLKLEVIPVRGDIDLKDGDTVYEGEYIKYNIKITNNSDNKIENITLKGQIPEGTTYGELHFEETGVYAYNFDDTVTSKEIKIEELKPNETVENFYEVRVDDLPEGVEEKQLETNVELNVDSSKVSEYKITNVVKNAEIKVFLSAMNDNAPENWAYNLVLEADEERDAVLKIKFPKEFTLDYIAQKGEKIEYSEDQISQDNVLTMDIKVTDEPYTFGGFVDLSDLKDTGKDTSELNLVAVATVQCNNEYKSNENRIKIENAKVSVKMSSDNEGEKVKYGDEINYKITIKNLQKDGIQGKEAIKIDITDYLPKELRPLTVTYDYWEYEYEKIYNEEDDTYYEVGHINKERKQKTEDISGSRTDTEGNELPNVDLTINIPSQETATILIKTTAGMVDAETKIENQLIVSGEEDNIKTTESNIVSHIILPYNYEEIEEPENPGEPEEPEEPENPDNPNNPDEPTNDKFGISGRAWLDVNGDGQRQDGEQPLEGITVMLVDMEKSNNVKERTETNSSGSYMFSNLENGKYTVIFQYDTSEYTVTEYQKANVSNKLNSDVTKQSITLNGNKIDVAVTDILQVNENLDNIDAGLTKSKKYDLKIDKYISQVDVSTNNTNQSYAYDNSKLAKIEIKAKEIEGAVVDITYKIVVTNEGEVTAKVNSIKDYFPEEMSLIKDESEYWNMTKRGELVNTNPILQDIKPGESKTLLLKVSLKMNSNNTGNYINKVEIQEANNSLGVRDIDSTEGNLKEGEDDFSQAELIISIGTGAVVYISIAIIAIILLSLVIFIILKKKKIKINKIGLIFVIMLSVMCLQITSVHAAIPQKVRFVYDRSYNRTLAQGPNPPYTSTEPRGEIGTGIKYYWSKMFTGGPTGQGICVEDGVNSVQNAVYTLVSSNVDHTQVVEKIEGKKLELSTSTSRVGTKEIGNDIIFGPLTINCSYDLTYGYEIIDYHGRKITNYTLCDANGNAKQVRGNTTFYIKIPKEKCIDGLRSIKVTAETPVTDTIKTNVFSTARYRYSESRQEVQTWGTFVSDTKTTTDTSIRTKDIIWDFKQFYGGFEIIKQDADNINVALPNVTVEVINEAYNYHETFTTDNTGSILITNLRSSFDGPDSSKEYPYTIRETINNNYGYTLKREDSVLVDNYGKIRKYSLINEKETGNLKLHKKDSDTGDILSGVGFKIRNSSGQYLIAVDESGNVQTRVTGTIHLGNLQTTDNIDSATEFFTDENGNLEIYNILTGTYTITETSLSDDDIDMGYDTDGDYIIWDTEDESGKGNSIKVKVERQKSFNTTTTSKVINDNKKVLDDGTYYIGVAASPNYVVEVQHAYSFNGTNVRLYEKNYTIAQRFYVRYIGNGYYKISTVSSHKMLDVANSGQEAGTNVQICEENGQDAQIWQIKKTSDGYYNLISKCNGLYLDLAGNVVANNTNIRVWTGNNSQAQKFTFTDISPTGDTESNEVNVGNRRKYIDLSGYVWEDKVLGKESTKNYLYRDTTADSEDKRLEHVTVNLVQDGQIIRSTSTDKDGNYKFEKIIIDDLDKMYVEFEYNGMSYQSFPADQIKIDEDNGSKALEGNERDEFNNNFAEVGPNQAYNSDGKETYKLEYTRENYESTLKFGDNPVYGYDGQRYPINNVYAQYMMSSNTYNAYNGNLDKIHTPDEIRKNRIKEITNVNLGLEEREQPDIAVVKDVESARVNIKKYSHTYKYAERFNNPGPYISGYTNEDGTQKDVYELNGNEKFAGASGKYGTMSYQRAIYKSDIYYDGEDKLEVHVTYRIGVKNQSTNLTSTVTNIADYYDANYTIAEIGTQINEEGSIIGGQLRYTNERYSNEYSKATIQVNTVVEPQTVKYIYIDFVVNEGTLKELGENDNNTKRLQNVAEIEGYRTTDSNGNVYGGIDLDSAPGNVNPADTSTFEDDTDRAPALELVIAQERSTSGKVFLDSTTGELKTGEERKGSGAYENGETGIQDVKVRLKEITNSNQIGETAKEYTSTGARELETTTDANGDFTLSGYIPGRYVLEYEWGDKTYKVQEYKNTIVDETAWNNKQNNEDWYKETFKKDNGEKNADGTDIRKSDALDEWSIRQDIDNQTGEDTNKLRQDIENAYNGDSSTGIITKMESRTPTYEVAIEYNEGPTTIDDEFERTGEGTILLQNNRPKQKITFKNIVENIDFGIVERPRQLLKIDKLVSNVRIRLTNSTLLVNAEIDENGNITNGAKYTVTAMLPKPGTVKVEIDNELIQGSTLEVKYGYKIENISETDYTDERYYKFGTGGRTPVTLTPSLMVDYLDKDYASNGNEDWQVIGNPKTSLVDTGLISNQVQENYLKNGLTSVLTTNKLNSTNMKVGDVNRELSLEESRLLSLTDEILLDNDVEIITTEKNWGSTIETTPGNYNPVDESTSEEDDSKAPHVIVTSPTGLPTYYIEYTILGLSCLGILVAGIVLIKKFVLKGKDK